MLSQNLWINYKNGLVTVTNLYFLHSVVYHVTKGYSGVINTTDYKLILKSKHFNIGLWSIVVLTAPQYTFIINTSNTELKTDYTKTITLSYFKNTAHPSCCQSKVRLRLLFGAEKMTNYMYNHSNWVPYEQCF